MKQTFVLLWRPDKRMIQAIVITFMPEYHLIYETSRRGHESQRLNDCSIFALRGLCVGRCSHARNKLKSHRGKNHCGKTLLLLCNVCKSVGRGKETGERQIWKGGRKVQWLNETKEVCKKCQKCAEGRTVPKSRKEKWGKKERSESMRRNFWRIDAAFLRWDWANSPADPDLRCPVDGWCIRLLIPTAPASNTHFLNTTQAHFPPH